MKKRKKRKKRLMRKMAEWRKKFGLGFFPPPTCCGAFMAREGMLLVCARGCGVTDVVA